MGAHWRDLVNTIKLLVCGGIATILSNYLDHLLELPLKSPMQRER